MTVLDVRHHYSPYLLYFLASDFFIRILLFFLQIPLQMMYNNLGMYHIQSKQKSRLFKTLICSECDTAGLYQVA